MALVLMVALLVPGAGSAFRLPISGLRTPAGDGPPSAQPPQAENQIRDWHQQAEQCYRQGQYRAAADLLEKALELSERAYPKDRFPGGHERQAALLDNLGTTYQALGEFARAQGCFERSLAMWERLYPPDRFPQGDPGLFIALNNLGVLHRIQGEYTRARFYYERALRMSERLYPKDKFPNGHAEAAQIRNNLGVLYQCQGEYARAHEYYAEALAIWEKLYPPEEFPRGQVGVANSLNNLGYLFMVQKDYARAQPYFERALALRERLYPAGKYPHGHAQLAESLNNLGSLYVVQRKYAAALPYYQKALAMHESLYPPTDFPQGHPWLATSLFSLGQLYYGQGEYRKASPYLKKSLTMQEALYPTGEVPGNPDVAKSLYALGMLCLRQEDDAAAQAYLGRAVAMNQDLAEVFAAAASEAEALNYAAQIPRARDGLLSTPRHLPATDRARCYETLWGGKAALLRILESRHRAVLRTVTPAAGMDAAARQQIRQLAQDLSDTRQQLARRLLAPAAPGPAHRGRLQQLSRHKEDLERQLAERLPEFRRRQTLEREGPATLAGHLPPRTAFVDCVRYRRFEHNPKVPGLAGERWTPCYVTFVVGPGQPVRRVDLAEAAPIDAAVAAWRRALADGRTSPAAAELRRLVWEPVARELPADTQTVLLAPDAALTRLPWAALPGARPGTVLLEEVAVAVVPHGHFVLDRLTSPPSPGDGPGLVLAVGGVRYDRDAAPAERPSDDVTRARLAERGGRGSSWPFLPGTVAEVDRVVALAGPRLVRVRRNTEAGTAQVLADLPRARWAHLATHGFFADASFRSALQLDEELFTQAGRGERAAPGARNPLVLSGLVLAGANRPVPQTAEELAHSDGGILTAEAVAGLPLHNLELAVLSACETGLGEVAGGEGVFGLQRAFHLAGAQAVVASLWRVDDLATQALMAEFYGNLWEKKLPKLEALRQAQLALLRRYDTQQGVLRGFQEAGAVDPKAKESARSRAGQAPPALWAGFVLSGDWR